MNDITIENILEYIKNYYKTNLKSPIMLDNNHPFRYYHIKKLFGTWNNALSQAGVPLNRHEIVLTECKYCNKSFNKQMKELLKSNYDFCSHSCSAKYNNKGRKMSYETKEKIRQKLIRIRYTNCVMCDKEFSFRKRKPMTCGTKCLSDLKKRNNKIKKGWIIPDE